jgi:hypothetical protein
MLFPTGMHSKFIFFPVGVIITQWSGIILGRGNELSHVGIKHVVEGLSFVSQLTFLDLRSLLTF